MRNLLLGAVRVAASFGLLAASLPGAPASAQATFGAAVNKPTAALAQFGQSFASVNDYTATIVTKEQTNDGQKSEARTYSYRYKKPKYASIAVEDGPGKGGGASWSGGDTVSGHQGGLFSHIHRTVAIGDPRATSLRGDTLDMASFDYDLKYMLSTPGTLSEAAGPSGTTLVTLARTTPASNGVSKIVLDLSNATHLPVERQQFAGATLVKTETFSDVKLNAGLKPEDF